MKIQANCNYCKCARWLRIGIRNGVRLALVCFVVFFGWGLGTVYGQGHLAVELGHPVYQIIDAAELRGVVTRLSSIKPYTHQQIAELLATMIGHMEAFSASEQALIQQYSEQFNAGTAVEQSIWQDVSGKAQVGIRVEATTRLDAGSIYDLIEGSSSTSFDDIWHLNSQWVPYIKAEPLSWLSFKG